MKGNVVSKEIEDLLIKEMSRQGLQITYNDEQLTIEPTVLRLKSITVNTVRRGRYITDPAFVPEELKDKNILWVDEPAKFYAVTESGEEIPVYCSEGITHNHQEIHPDDN